MDRTAPTALDTRISRFGASHGSTVGTVSSAGSNYGTHWGEDRCRRGCLLGIKPLGERAARLNNRSSRQAHRAAQERTPSRIVWAYNRTETLLLASLLVCLVVTSGCHSLRARRQTRELSDARQSSLRGAEKLQQHKLEEAELLFTDALRSSSADERAQAGMAEVLWQRDESDKAIEHMTQAAVISGGNPDYLVRLGEMNLQQGNLKQALAQADAALDGQRSHSGAWALRGKVLQQRGELEAAMTCYHRTLSEQPHTPEVQVALAEIYRALGRPQRALATLDSMTDGKSGEQISPQAWMLKGQALADLGEASAANHCLRNAALCCRDEDTSTILSLARLQIEAGEIAEARAGLGRAFRCDPYNPTALQLQAVLDRGPSGGVSEGMLGSSPARLVGFERAPPREVTAN